MADPTPTMGASQRETFGRTMIEIVDAHPAAVLLDGDLANSTRADILAEARPDRFFQMGIAEQNMVGAAAGMAAMGLIPFVSTFACFAVCRALDQVRVLVAQPHANVKLIGGYSGLLTGMTGKTHQVVDDLAIMRAMPQMTVVAPADDVEARAALHWAASHEGPVYVRLTRDPSPRLFDDEYRFDGKGIVLRQGDDVTIIGTGVQSARALEAAVELSGEGIEATVLHLPLLKPLDTNAIIEAAERTRLVVTTEDHTVIGGLGGAVSETLATAHPLPVHRHGITDTFGESAPNDALLDKYQLSSTHLAAFVRAAVQGRRAAGGRKESNARSAG
jgi:transketolase